MQLAQIDQTPQTQKQSNKDWLDAFQRMAVWGPIGLFGALGKQIPTPLKFVMVGTSILQITYGYRDMKRLTNPNVAKIQTMQGLRNKRRGNVVL